MSTQIQLGSQAVVKVEVKNPSTSLASQQLVGVTVSNPSTTLILGVGVPGQKGDAGSSVATYTAASAVSGHVIVTVNSSGQAIPADPTNLAHSAAILGITQNAASGGGSLNVQNSGYMSHSGWNFTPQQPVFLGTMGAISQTVPSGALFSKAVGVAVSATSMVISLQPAIILS